MEVKDHGIYIPSQYACCDLKQLPLHLSGWNGVFQVNGGILVQRRSFLVG